MKAEDFGELAEQRKYYRVRRKMKVRCRVTGSDDADTSGRSLDMSLGGIRLSLKHEIPSGKTLELTLNDEKNDLLLVLTGRVVRGAWNHNTGRYEIGIQFPDLAPTQLENVRALIGRDETAGGKQNRRSVRLKKHLIVEIRRSGRFLAKKLLATSVDISLDGMAAQAEKPCKTGVLYEARIFLPAEKKPPSVKAHVLETRRHHGVQRWLMRMRFVEFEGEARNRIGRFLSAEIRRRFP